MLYISLSNDGNADLVTFVDPLQKDSKGTYKDGCYFQGAISDQSEKTIRDVPNILREWAEKCERWINAAL